MGIEQLVDFRNLKTLKIELTRFMMAYKFALDEMTTKINILKDEFNYIHDYNPIEHVKSRIKSPESILKKCKEKALILIYKVLKKILKTLLG